MASDQILASLATESNERSGVLFLAGGAARTPAPPDLAAGQINRPIARWNCYASPYGAWRSVWHISHTLKGIHNHMHNKDPNRFEKGMKVFKQWGWDDWYDQHRIFKPTCHRKNAMAHSNSYTTVFPKGTYGLGWDKEPHWNVLNNSYDLYGWMYDGDRQANGKYSMSIDKRKRASAKDYRSIQHDSNVLKKFKNMYKLTEHSESHLPSCSASSALQNDTRFHITCPTKGCSFHSTYIPLMNQVSDQYYTSRNISGALNNAIKADMCAIDGFSYPTCHLTVGDPAWYPACCLNSLEWGMDNLYKQNKIKFNSGDLKDFQNNTGAAFQLSQANPFQLKFLCDSQHRGQKKEGTLSDPCYQILPTACNLLVEGGPALLSKNHPCYHNWFQLFSEFMYGELTPTDKQVNELVALSRSAVDFCNDHPDNQYCKCLTHKPMGCNGGPCLYWTVMDNNYYPVQAINKNSGSTLSIDDYVCAYPPCQRAGKNQRCQLTTMAMQRRQNNTCPTSTCYQIITDRTLTTKQVCGNQGIYVGNNNMICDGNEKCKTAGTPTMSLNSVHHSLYYDRGRGAMLNRMFMISNQGAFKSCLRPRIKSCSIKCPEGTNCYNSTRLPNWITIPDNLDHMSIHGGGAYSQSLKIQVGPNTTMADGTYTLTIVLHDPHVTQTNIEQTITLKIFVFTSDGPVPPAPGGKIPPHTGSAMIRYKKEPEPFYQTFYWILLAVAAFFLVGACLLFFLSWWSTNDNDKNDTKPTSGGGLYPLL
jgi:hypothetical protein